MAAVAALLAAGALSGQEARTASVEGDAVVSRSLEKEGVGVDLAITPLEEGAESLREGDYAEVRIRLRDAGTGRPLETDPPAAWVDFRRGEEATPTRACEERIAGYLKQRMKNKPPVDLNSYYVLTLNRGNTVSVLSPFFGMGKTQTVTTVRLPGQGADWALDEERNLLWVTVPLRNLLVAVDTETWEIAEEIEVGRKPVRLRLGPDARLWVALDAGPGGGVAVVDPASREVVGRLTTGPGPHRLVFPPDGDVAYVSDRGAGTVSVVDVGRQEVVDRLETGPAPSDVAFSPRSGRLYVVDREDGSVTIVDGETRETVLRMPGTPGKTEIRFDPSGRWGFILNPGSGEVLVLDADVDRIRHGFEGEGRPYRVAFTERFAYVRSEEVPHVAMIALPSLAPGGGGAFAEDFRSQGREMRSESGVRAVTFPAGQHPPGKFGDPGVAQPMAAAPHRDDGVYVAAPGDKALYFYHYMEGMPTPSGTLKTYVFEPLAALVVGRRMDEVATGEYRAVIPLPDASQYDFVFALDEPRVVHCFPFRVAAGPEADGSGRQVELALRAGGDRRLVAGREEEIRFRVVERATGRPRQQLGLVVRLTSTTGWRTDREARALEDGGYAVSVRPPEPGVYYLTVRVPELGKGFRSQPPLILRAVPPGQASADRGRR